MIPRPRSEAAARHDPGRWICNKNPEGCDGTFRVYGQDMPCPIRAKCWFGRRNTYQWTPGKKLWGRYPELDVDVERRRQHANQLAGYRRLWGPKPPPRTEAQRQRHADQMRARRAAQAADRPPPPEKPLRRPLLPCGEDCAGGCPYDTCPYTDADLDALEAAGRREALRAQAKEKHARERAREAVDPKYKARRRELGKRRNKRYYEAHKETIKAKARERARKKRGGAAGELEGVAAQ